MDRNTAHLDGRRLAPGPVDVDREIACRHGRGVWTLAPSPGEHGTFMANPSTADEDHA